VANWRANCLRDPLGFKSTQGRLCWSSVTKACPNEPTDWRRRALAAEAARDELIEAVLAVHREDDAERAQAAGDDQPKEDER